MGELTLCVPDIPKPVWGVLLIYQSDSDHRVVQGHPLRTALYLGSCLSCLGGRAKQSKKVTTEEVARLWKQSNMFGDLYQVTYTCPFQNAIGTWFINCSCFSPQARMTGMGPGRR